MWIANIFDKIYLKTQVLKKTCSHKVGRNDSMDEYLVKNSRGINYLWTEVIPGVAQSG